MLEIKDKVQIGEYLRKIINLKFDSGRKFCIEYIRRRDGEIDSEEVRKLANRLCQIEKGEKYIQIHDLPLFSEILGISYEDILSAGEIRKPISNRMTNYNVAFSDNENDWINYLNNQNCIASYADEYGKTVIDYAIEFKNYKLLKYLMDSKLIQLVSPDKDWGYGLNYGASTTIKNRPYDQNTIEKELYDNKILRTQILTLAIENSDDKILEELKAREIPAQLRMDIYRCNNVTFNEYYDDEYIDKILNSREEIFNYFCEEYMSSNFYKKHQFKWIYPFFDKLIEKSISTHSNRSNKLLDNAIEHNKKAFIELKQCILDTAKKEKRIYINDEFQKIIEHELNYLNFNENKTIYCFNCYYIENSKWSATNIIKVSSHSKDQSIQKKIDELNDIYNSIINIKDVLIKPLNTNSKI